jgi:hypothetical protein
MLATILTSFSTVNIQLSRVCCFAKWYKMKFRMCFCFAKWYETKFFMFWETSKIREIKSISHRFIVLWNKI